MRIKRIRLKNYRQFLSTEMTFAPSETSDLHIIIGRNGTGKTNLLNAINWCLYGDEPHLSQDLPSPCRPNLHAVNGLAAGDELEVCVDVWADADDGTEFTFLRQEYYRQSQEGGAPVRTGAKLKVGLRSAGGDSKYYFDAEGTTVVERFVPKGLRDFFFFDGERLDRYFKEATGQNVRHAVFQISRLDLVERVEENLDKLAIEMRRAAGQETPGAISAADDVERCKNGIRDLDSRIADCQKQIKLAREKFADYADKLKDKPDVKRLVEEREAHQREIEATRTLLSQRNVERHAVLVEGATLGLLKAALDKTRTIIQAKRKRGEIPPAISDHLLKDSVTNNRCTVCDRALDHGSAEHITDLMRVLAESSEVTTKLTALETPIALHLRRIADLPGRLLGLARELARLDGDVEKATKRIAEIDVTLGGYDDAKIVEWQMEYAKWDKEVTANTELLGGLKNQRVGLEADLEAARKRYERALDVASKVSVLRRQLKFCEGAESLAGEAKLRIMTENRLAMEAETQRLFMDFLWKKHTYQAVKIDADYNLDLIHTSGLSWLGITSAAERELLALSFTLALHHISKRDAPIMIDTPVARISDEHRDNFGKILSVVGTTRQTILLFTPSEFSSEIQESMRQGAASVAELTLQSSEEVTTLKEIS